MGNYNSIKEFFAYLNDHCEYLILRNWADVYNDNIYGDSHEDIDILCGKLDEFVQLTNAKRIHKEKQRSNFVVPIGSMSVRFDVRYVGDGYYPIAWQQKMLRDKIMTEQGFYIMNPVDYTYSLTYHALLQKPKLSEEYRKKINSAFADISSISEESSLVEHELIERLKQHCYENGYVVEIPIDPGVYLNYRNIKRMNHEISVHRILKRGFFVIKNVVKRHLQ